MHEQAIHVWVHVHLQVSLHVHVPDCSLFWCHYCCWFVLAWVPNSIWYMYILFCFHSETVNDYSILPRILERPGGLLTQIFDTAWTVKINQFALTTFFFCSMQLGLTVWVFHCELWYCLKCQHWNFSSYSS